MSYDISLYDANNNVCVSSIKIQQGGTQVVGGTKECSLNITSNYSEFYYLYLDAKEGIRWLYGKTGKETLNRLQNALHRIRDMPSGKTIFSDNYWAPTAGNAAAPIETLARWAEEFPNAIWQGD